MTVDATIEFILPILVEKNLSAVKKENREDRFTVALKKFSSGSSENVPGSRVKSCTYPRVIIDVPYWTRVAVIPDGVIRTYTEDDELNMGEVTIITVNLN